MKNIKFAIALLLLFLLRLPTNAQTKTNPCEVSIMSPETATLGRFGSYPVSYYSGAPQISIPLYTLKVDKIEVPISIRYDASGFMPNKESGKIGQNWVLNAGGVITRSVNVIPDENRASTLLSPILSGFWYGINNLNEPISGEDIKYLKDWRDNSYNYPYTYEQSPDVFSFNFGEHSGQFLIGNDGKVKVISDKKYKIDLSGFAMQMDKTGISPSRIKITTDDGYVYTFGGDPSSLEISLLGRYTTEGRLENAMYHGIVKGFYLTNITTQDGSSIDFIYENENLNPDVFYDGNNVLKTCYFSDFTNVQYGPAATQPLFNVSNTPTTSLIKIVYLSEIKSSLGSVKFNYSTKEGSFYGEHLTFPWKKHTKKLDQITICNNSGNQVNKIGFVQSYKKAKKADNNNDYNCYRLFLDKVIINDKLYQFSYSDSSNLPDPTTRSIDFWGYYNNSGATSLLPVNIDSRKPSFIDASKGVLNKIVYPTGGFTDFEFENHDYGIAIKRIQGQSSLYPIQVEGEGIVGGLRVKQVKNTPGETRLFSYRTEGERNEISSGVFNDNRLYMFMTNFEHIGKGVNSWIIAGGDNILPAFSNSDPYIGYSQVTETVQNGDCGKIVYNYTSVLTHPDDPILGENTYNLYNRTTIDPELKNKLISFLKSSSRELERGKLSEKLLYSADNILLKKSIYTYTNYDFQQRQRNAIYDINFPIAQVDIFGMQNSYAHYYYPIDLIKEETIDYPVSGQQINTLTEYQYNPTNRLLNKEITITSKGDIYTRNTYYPTDFIRDSTYADMVSKFVIKPIIQFDEQLNGNLIKSTKFNYYKFKNKFFAPSSVEITTNGLSDYKKMFVYHDYDERGNLLSFTDDKNLTSTYLWGYNNQYPITKIENASLENVRKYISEESQKNIAAKSTPTEHDFNQIVLLKSQLSNAMITTYSYAPLVGLTSQTTPNGITTSYLYDKWGRLTSVFDNNQFKLNDCAYDYSSKLSLPNVKFNCDSIYEINNSGNFIANASGGSGYYLYSWTLKNNMGEIIQNVSSASSPLVTFQFLNTGSMTLTCTITDVVSGANAIYSKNIIVNPHTIYFKNITTRNDITTGRYIIEADIDCSGLTEISFQLDYSVASASNPYVEYHIGNSNYKRSGKEMDNVTLNLPDGRSHVCIEIVNAMTYNEASLCLVSVEGLNNIGSVDCLSVCSE